MTLIGPSGCGKSTLLRLIAGLTGADGGTLAVNGKTPDAARLDRDYSMVFQRAGLFDWRNVSRNIELPLELMGWKASRPAPARRGDAGTGEAHRSSPAITRRSCPGGCSSVWRSLGRCRSAQSCC